MKTILTLQEKDVNPNSEIAEPKAFRLRRAARAVVTDAQGRVALLHVSRQNYHKLPGGGIDEGEDIATALERELLEEIGCQAKVTAEIGEIEEYRNQWGLHQTSYCYMAQQFGEQKPPDFTEEELSEGFEIRWVDSIDEAIAILGRDVPANYDGSFIQPRDSAILKAAKALVSE
jgi:8-oxo-dGTP pyrophosphatase MutT (NUDIX family)